MGLVITSALRAVEDLAIPGIMKLFLICLFSTLLVMIIVAFVGFWAASGAIDTIAAVTEEESSWLYWIILIGAYAIAISGIILTVWLSFWSLVILIANFFDENIAQKVEENRYPDMSVGKSKPFWPEFRHDLGFMVKIVFINIITVALFIFIFPLLPFALMVVNGYLVGQEFFTMAGGRHIGRAAAYQLAKQHRSKILFAGVAMLFGSTIPLLNLVIPFWGVAMMVHLYHAIAMSDSQFAADNLKHTDSKQTKLLPPGGN